MPINIEEYDGNKKLVTVKGNRGNSFGVSDLEQFLEELDKMEQDDSVDGIVLTGAGRVFSVGGDVFSMHEALEKGDPNSYLEPVVPLIERVVTTLLQYPKPVIAAVNGAAAGGGLSLALACDEIFCVPHAKFGMAFGGLALTPDSGSSVLFTHHFGRKDTIHGISTARVFTAKEVEERNIATIVEPEELLETAAARVDENIVLSAHSYAKTKLLVNQPLLRELEHNLPLEYETIKEAALREEFKRKVQETVERLSK